MPAAVNPSLYQINTRIWLRELSAKLGKQIPLADVPEAELDALAAQGFDWVWLLGVWQTGPQCRAVARQHPDLRPQYFALVPDLKEEEILASPFALQSYVVDATYGGDMALSHLRQRLQSRGLKLLLDFVPNHTGLDHPWVREHPEYYVAGTADLLAREPQNYRRIATRAGEKILAHGRDPYFPGWTDTLQLNYRHQGLRAAMVEELLKIATQCDGVRCDMAMLVLPEVIQRTWGQTALPSDGSAPVDTSFWTEAIAAVKHVHPDFLFMAETYWDLEWTLQQQGFAYTYDKKYYDRLLLRDAHAVRGHLHADPIYQHQSVRFLENHDEPRAAAAILPAAYEATAVLAFLVPGLRFFHEGQFEGRRQRLMIQLGRRPVETPNPAVHSFYDRLLAILRHPEVRDGQWHLLGCRPAWDGNPTWGQFLTFGWRGEGGQRLLVTVNFGPDQGQCYVTLPTDFLPEAKISLRDLLHPVHYEREQLAFRGLYLDLPAWGYHVFAVEPLP